MRRGGSLRGGMQAKAAARSAAAASNSNTNIQSTALSYNPFESPAASPPASSPRLSSPSTASNPFIVADLESHSGSSSPSGSGSLLGSAFGEPLIDLDASSREQSPVPLHSPEGGGSTGVAPMSAPPSRTPALPPKKSSQTSLASTPFVRPQDMTAEQKEAFKAAARARYEAEERGEVLPASSPSNWASSSPRNEGEPLWKRMADQAELSNGQSANSSPGLSQSAAVTTTASATNPFADSDEDTLGMSPGVSPGGGKWLSNSDVITVESDDSVSLPGDEDDKWAASGSGDGTKKKKFKGAMKGLKSKTGAAAAAAKQKAIAAKESQAVENAKARAAAAKQRAAEKARDAHIKDKAAAGWGKTKSGAAAAAQKTGELKRTATKEVQRRRQGDEGSGGATAGPPKPQPDPPVDPTLQVFGLSVEAAAERSGTRVENVPDVVSACVDSIRERSLKEEGIFRLSGSALTIKSMRQQFDRGECPDVFSAEEHAVTGLLKLFLREIPGSIFGAVAGQVSQDADVSLLAGAVRSMTPAAKATLEYVIRLLVDVAALQEVNKMTVQNICIVFSPTLGCHGSVVSTLIRDVDTIFLDEMIQL